MIPYFGSAIIMPEEKTFVNIAPESLSMLDTNAVM